MATHSLSIAARKRLLHPEQFRRPDNRASAAARGYDRAWSRVRGAFLKANPLCSRCNAAPADTVHHRREVDQHPELRLTWSNLEGLCRACHEQLHGRAGGDYETATEPQNFEKR